MNYKLKEFKADKNKRYRLINEAALLFYFRNVIQMPVFMFPFKIGLVEYWNEFGWPNICHQLDNGDFECD